MALDAQKPWPADKVERWPVTRLVPYAKNSRTHSPAQVSQIAGSIREWGFTVPVLVDEGGTIIAGHARTQAAQQLGLTDIPVMVASGWSDAQKRAYVIADNKLTLNAGWDESLLAMELGDLDGFDLSLTGFDDAELARLLHGVGPGAGVDPDDTPEPPVSPVSVLGDVWLLGKHRLVCGDSTDASVVAKALNGVQPHLMVTDPPYGVEYDPGWRNETGHNSEGKTVRISSGSAVRASRSSVPGSVLNDDRSDWRNAWLLFPGDVAYIWHGERQLISMGEQLTSVGFEPRNLIVWAKSCFAISRGHYHSQHETCWYAVRKGGTGHWAGDRKQSTLWQIDKPLKSETGHGTQKPVECMKRPIENNSSPGQAVYEPFSGSGTTIIAAEMTGRACHAIELSPTYVDVAVKRWAVFAGQTPIHEATGKTFEELSGDR